MRYGRELAATALIVVGLVLIISVIMVLSSPAPQQTGEGQAKATSGTIRIEITNTGRFTDGYTAYFNNRLAWTNYECVGFGEWEEFGSTMFVEAGNTLIVRCDNLPFATYLVEVEMNSEVVATRTFTLTENNPEATLTVNTGR